MKTIAASALLLTLLITAQAQRYHITGLGALPGGSGGATASAINDRGQIVGTSDTTNPPRDPLYSETHPFLWFNGQMQDLGGGQFSGATDINNHGQVAGASTLGSDDLFFWPFLWSGGSTKNLGSVGPLGLGGGAASAINDRGIIVGSQQSFYVSGQTLAFIYNNGVMSDMGIGTGKAPKSINIFNQVVGNSSSPSNQVFLWQGGNLRTIPTLGGTEIYVSSSRALNDWGQIVGTSSLPGDNVYHAFIYINGKSYDLTPQDAENTSAIAINNLGLVVGSDSGGVFILRVGGKVRHLNDLIDSSGVGWVGLTAVGINDLGQIAGNGTHNGLYEPFLLSPH